MKLIQGIRRLIELEPKFVHLNNLFEITRHKEERDVILEQTKLIKKHCVDGIGNKKLEREERLQYVDLFDKCLLLEAPILFESYMLYMEKDRAPEKRFYLPRRKVLGPLVKHYQDVADGVIEFLGISMPPRVGKSTLGIFYTTWQMGRFPDRAIIMSGHSSPLTQGFYDEALSLISDEEYNWSKIFPGNKIYTNAKDTRLDINKKRRFSTLTCRSIGSTLTGATEADNFLYSDDMVEDIEEAINPDRMASKFDAYANQLRDRKKVNSHEIMVGTRWSEDDPLGVLQDKFGDDPRYRFVVVPALDENGESNFDFGDATDALRSISFTTEYYRDMERTIDANTFAAKYQGAPYSRDGLLFDEELIKWYDGSNFDYSEADKIYSITDVAWGGGDDLVTLIAIIFDKEVYIHDFYISDKAKDITRPMVVNMLAKYRPHNAQFEANNGGHEYADWVRKHLQDRQIFIDIENKVTTSKTNKLAKIIQYSPEIMQFNFRNDSKRGKDYDYAMRMLTRFTQTGKVKKDDVPDALSMLAIKLANNSKAIIRAFKRTLF